MVDTLWKIVADEEVIPPSKKGWTYVWRLEVETDYGTMGIFHGGAAYISPSVYYYKGKSLDPRLHPTPDEEGLPIKNDLYCGFSSIKQYRKWFPLAEMRRIIASRKVVLKKYRVQKKDLHKGQMQVMFRKRNAIEVEQRCPAYADYKGKK